MFLLYYKNGCHFSHNAEKLLSLYNLFYHKITVDNDSVIRSTLLLKPYYHRTMPSVFFYPIELTDDDIKMANMCIPENGLFIGGYDKLNNLMSKILSLTKDNLKQIYQEYKIIDGRLSYVEFLRIAIYVIKTIKGKQINRYI